MAPEPSGVASSPSIGTARFAPGSRRNSPGPVPMSIVPSPGSTVIEVMYGEPADPPSAAPVDGAPSACPESFPPQPATAAATIGRARRRHTDGAG